MLGVEDWAEIRRLHRAEGLPIKLIARTLGVSRNTVRAALASDEPPRYERPPRPSVVDGVELDRGTDRLGAFDPDVVESGGGAAPRLPAGRSRVAHDL